MFVAALQVDDEGTLETTDVKATFINGKPSSIVARFSMRTQFEWDRFMRFMDRYAEENGLGFEGSAKKMRWGEGRGVAAV